MGLYSLFFVYSLASEGRNCTLVSKRIHIAWRNCLWQVPWGQCFLLPMKHSSWDEVARDLSQSQGPWPSSHVLIVTCPQCCRNVMKFRWNGRWKYIAWCLVAFHYPGNTVAVGTEQGRAMPQDSWPHMTKKASTSPLLLQNPLLSLYFTLSDKHVRLWH
jgi:hypothetical protein